MDFGCFLQSYPPAWPCVMLPGTSCKPAPPRAGGAITTGYQKLGNFDKFYQNDKFVKSYTDCVIDHGIAGYIFQSIVEIHCGQQISAFSLINPVEETLQVCQFGHLTDLSPCWDCQ